MATSSKVPVGAGVSGVQAHSYEGDLHPEAGPCSTHSSSL